jgi:adenine-specific DNA methylase
MLNAEDDEAIWNSLTDDMGHWEELDPDIPDPTLGQEDEPEVQPAVA